MTSQINVSNIDPTFPIAGQINDSQGFRTNFANIKSNLTTAKNEITDLQTRSVIVADQTNNPVINNIMGSSLINFLYSNMRGTVYTNTNVFESIDVNLNQAPLQIFTITAEGVALSLTGLPSNNQFLNTRVHILSGGTETWVPTIDSTHDIYFSDNFPTLTLIENHVYVLDIWAHNSNLVFVNFVGDFYAPAP